MRFFSSDNFFTRLMNRIGILAAVNLMFILCCLPVITAGAGFAALYYTMLHTLRESGDINPFRTFRKGFRENFRQATFVWLALLGMAVIVYLEIFWCGQFASPISFFRYGLYAIAVALTIIATYIFPVIGAFQCTLPQLLKNSVGFAFQKPAVTLVLLFLNVVPIVWTFFTNAYMPLYAFIWCTVGFSGIALLCSKLLLPLFSCYLTDSDDWSNINQQKTEDQILKEMRELEG